MTDVYQIHSIDSLLRGSAYPGRGIVLGRSAGGDKACAAYFIMGRSANSRSRVLVREDGGVSTRPLDGAKVRDAGLIVYPALRRYENKLIVTNGDQTDTVLAGLRSGLSFAQALEKRSFEPDAPNFTPRISGIISFGQGGFSYQLSILKSLDGRGGDCCRYLFSYPSLPGLGHFIHTYMDDGDPLPSFQGEPRRVYIPDSMDEFTESLWDALNADNRIALYVCYTDVNTGASEDRLINKYGGEARP